MRLLLLDCDAVEGSAGGSRSITATFTHLRLDFTRVDCTAPGGTEAQTRAAPCDVDAARE